MYEPRLGRFIQTDPLFKLRPFEHYLYTHNHPCLGVDPSGMKWEIKDNHLIWSDSSGIGDYGELYKGSSLTRDQTKAVQEQLRHILREAGPEGINWVNHEDLPSTLAMLLGYTPIDAISGNYDTLRLMHTLESSRMAFDKGEGFLKSGAMIDARDVKRIIMRSGDAFDNPVNVFAREHPLLIGWLSEVSLVASYAAIALGQQPKTQAPSNTTPGPNPSNVKIGGGAVDPNKPALLAGGYEPSNNTLYLGVGYGHGNGMGAAGGVATRNTAGITVGVRGNTVFWACDSQSLPASLTPQQAASVQAGLKAQFPGKNIIQVKSTPDVANSLKASN